MMRLIILGFDHEMESANPELADVVEQLVKAEEVVFNRTTDVPGRRLSHDRTIRRRPPAAGIRTKMGIISFER
jgi:hypothetical protein